MVDAEVGRVYDALRHSRHSENTLFILTSDHGEMGGHHNLFKKGQFYDAALRVPLVCVLGGRAAAGRRDGEHLVSGPDIPATILDYAGLEPMPKMTVARSLRPLLEGTPTKWRDYVVAESNSASGPRRAVCMKDFKAFLNQDGSASLYSLKDDPLEMRDLARDRKYAEQLARARAFHNEYVDRITLHPRLRSFGKI
ncbi:MAG: sulfatase family protein [Planctomycetota bacterium]